MSVALGRETYVDVPVSAGTNQPRATMSRLELPT